MLSTIELRAQLEQMLNDLGFEPDAKPQIRFLDHHLPNILMDVAIYLDGECLALGRFHPVKQWDITGEDFTQRFCAAMSYPDDAWYLFDFDGERMVINDLSLKEPVNDHPDSLASGMRRLTMLPAKWREEQKKLDEMLRFVESMRYLLAEEAISNPVK
jgi:hypothetical protein